MVEVRRPHFDMYVSYRHRAREGGVRRVIVVDDDRHFRGAVRYRLEQAGYEAVAAKDGGDLLDRLGMERADLIILDLDMPGLSGLEVLECLRADAELRRIPVLVATGRRDGATRARCMELGARACYAKPLSLRKLAASVEACLG
jgi:DNA-binding response OmpR family regulator